MNKHDAGIRNDLIISESQCVRRNIQNHHVVGQITSVLVDDVAHALILRLQCNAFEKFFFFFFWLISLALGKTVPQSHLGLPVAM